MNAVSPIVGSNWECIKSDFKGQFPADVYAAWFAPLQCLKETEDELILGVQNEFASIWIEDNYLDLIKKKLHLATGHTMDVSLRIVGSPVEEAPADKEDSRVAPVGASRIQGELDSRPGLKEALKPSGGTPEKRYILNPRNTFDNFVVGLGNQLAHAACIAVANSPARAYNPLFLYGETGLGKTHLMHAIAHQVMARNPRAHVAYISTEKFTNEFIRAIQENDLIKFRQRYRSVDVLLIDDIHFLSGKERIQEEFFHTF
ncbi:MAG TPA: chromosomal replication initiator protein DnaA, partial [Opitutae bacterium]|nr:chromosomal replication initiator protein DnaA [Opitutae bacterium]